MTTAKKEIKQRSVTKNNQVIREGFSEKGRFFFFFNQLPDLRNVQFSVSFLNVFIGV